MKKLIAVFLLALATSCSSIKVSYDYDREVDFAKYQTYAFTEESSKMQVDEFNRNRILKAVETELATKGLAKSDTPDALVDVQLKTAQRTEATAITSGYGTGYGYVGGYGYRGRYVYGGGFSTTQINIDHYTDGTLFVSLIDKASNKIAWQGRGTKTLEEDASPAQREKTINDAVKKIFLNYPPPSK